MINIFENNLIHQKIVNILESENEWVTISNLKIATRNESVDYSTFDKFIEIDKRNKNIYRRIMFDSKMNTYWESISKCIKPPNAIYTHKELVKQINVFDKFMYFLYMNKNMIPDYEFKSFIYDSLLDQWNRNMLYKEQAKMHLINLFPNDVTDDIYLFFS